MTQPNPKFATFSAFCAWLMLFFILPFSNVYAHEDGVYMALCTSKGVELVWISSESEPSTSSHSQIHCPCASEVSTFHLALLATPERIEVQTNSAHFYLFSYNPFGLPQSRGPPLFN